MAMAMAFMYVGAKRRKEPRPGEFKELSDDGMHITHRMTVVDPDFWGTLHTVGGLRRLRLVHTTYSSRTVSEWPCRKSGNWLRSDSKFEAQHGAGVPLGGSPDGKDL